MTTIRIQKGLDLPITGRPRQVLGSGPSIRRVALIGDDYVGMKPSMAVDVGDSVKRGQLLFTDKKTEGVRHTSPGAGRVVEVNRGEKRRFLSVVIELEGEESVNFPSHTESGLMSLTDSAVRENLIESGLWTAFRTRPFSRVPAIDSRPSSIFVTAIDTQPLAADPSVVIRERGGHWVAGLQILQRLDAGPVFLCQSSMTQLPSGDGKNIKVASFEGPHPAGLAGTHIHHLDPVHVNKTVWTIGYQDVIAIGELFLSGRYPADRIVALGGPAMHDPRIVKTVMGASLEDLTRDRLKVEGSDPDAPGVRMISGSVFGGRAATGKEVFLGRYHTAVAALTEGTVREFLGWQKPGFDKFSITRIFASAPAVLAGTKRFAFTTSTEGSKRAMVPIGSYETIMPLDILPTHLLRALIVRDTDEAQLLGALELDEEDLALCTFVCPGKYEYGPILRDNLTRIEREG